MLAQRVLQPISNLGLDLFKDIVPILGYLNTYTHKELETAQS